MAKKIISGVVETPIAQKVSEFFAQNPKEPIAYSTTDGFLFTTKKFAYDHARTLGDDEPKVHNSPLAAANDEQEAEEETDQE